MAATSAVNPSRKPLPMPQTDWDRLLSLSLSGQRLGRKQKGSALRHLPSLRHSCRRSGRSPALPYPPHEFIHSFYHPCLPPCSKGTSLLWKTGDISILG